MNKLFGESESFVVLNQVFKMIRKDDDLKTTESCSSEFLGSYASEADFFPNLRDISFFSSFECSSILLELNQNLSKLLVVSNVGVEDSGSFKEFLIKASITTFLDVSLVWLSNESLKVREVSLSAFSISENELRVNHLFFKDRSGHEKILNEFFEAILVLSSANNKGIH